MLFYFCNYKISKEFLELKYEELALHHEYQLKKLEEKEIEILAEKETFLTEAVSWKTDPLLDF